MENAEVEILLVEDNINDAELAMRVLRKNSIANNIVHVKDGAVALDFLFGKGQYQGRNVNYIPAVILLDLKMPKVSGIEVLELIKSNELTKKIPVVMLTSSKEHSDVDKCYLLGVNSYIVKPVDFENFSKTISEVGIYWMLLNQQWDKNYR
jgi:two-component system response regulator